MKRRSLMRASFLVLTILILAGLCGLPSTLNARDREDENDKNRPERGILLFTEYSGIYANIGENVNLALHLENKGKTDENCSVKITSTPKGWKTSIKGLNYPVYAVPVPEGEKRVMNFFAEPEKGLPPGTYIFQIEAQTEDEKLTSSQKLSVTVRAKGAVTQAIKVTTAYPELRGPNDTKFEFSLDVNNQTDTDKNFTLSAQIPDKWEVVFKPAWEEKQITSLQIKADKSENVKVNVTPAKEAVAGDYPVIVTIGSGEQKTVAKLAVVLTGVYKLDVGTVTGLLSLDAVKGKPANMSIYIKNTGSAINRGINLSSFKPENWKVEFKPEKIDALEPGAMKQVEITITSAAEALVGDYSVGLSVEGEKANKTVEMRVSVKASAAWGWVGIIIIVIVIAGLGGLFLWLGRR
jgi:uncharacterized membrane protein